VAKKQFKAESKRLLDLMINSIYTHKEIFLRELISNASDASDKRYYNALTTGETGIGREQLFIEIKADKESRTLTLSDRGCGMTREELEANLGVIAHSGSLEYKKDNTDADIDIIGQFGVGFYSAFMVSNKVVVETKAQATGEAWRWESSGADGYTIQPGSREEVGTDVVLTIKPDSEEENYSEFLDDYRLRALVKKYSDYIRYPIRMEMTKSQRKEGSPDDAPEYEDITQTETLNSMIPLWKKPKSQVPVEDYNRFYKDKYFDYEDPLRVIVSSTEGSATYDALLFVPARAPFDFYSKEYQKGLQLYASGVMIMDKCADLLPDCFSFMRGLVDSQDLSLNLSREMLQHDRQLRLIAARLEKKIKSELLSMLKDERENYEKFYRAFGLQMKYGLYASYGQSKELLADLLLYESSYEKKPVTLDEYVSRMKTDQKYIYFASGESVARLRVLPQAERLTERGYEILYMTDSVDEFVVRMMRDYADKEFKSITEGDLGIDTEQEREDIEQKTEQYRTVLNLVKERLGEKIEQVRLTGRLKSFPVCLAAEGDISLEMERVLSTMPTEQKVKARRVLEMNPDHPVFSRLFDLAEKDPDKAGLYIDILYQQALLLEGYSVEDPAGYTEKICALMQ
jgi:molecular chaperone HtpG